jgi:hypothetical protein
MIRFNFLYPPFNNEKMRQAVMYMVTLDMLKNMGLNAEIQAGDWGTLITRRAV